jgi:hypothetical protein
MLCPGVTVFNVVADFMAVLGLLHARMAELHIPHDQWMTLATEACSLVSSGAPTCDAVEAVCRR